jgi:hypothetical protein
MVRHNAAPGKILIAVALIRIGNDTVVRAADEPIPKPDGLVFLLGEHERAVKAIDSIGYHYEAKFDASVPRLLKTRTIGDVAIKGGNRFVTYQEDRTTSGGSASARVSAIITPTFITVWRSDSQSAFIYRSESAEQQTEYAKVAAATQTGIEYLRIGGFGLDGYGLRQLCDIDKPPFDWTVEETKSGSTTVQIVKRFTDPRTKYPLPNLEFEIAPGSGYLITKSVSYNDGIADVEIDTEPQRIAETNIYVPKQITKKGFGPTKNSDGRPAVLFELHASLSQVKVNADVADSYFEIANMKLPAGCPVKEVASDGKITGYIWNGHDLVPPELWSAEINRNSTHPTASSTRAESETVK